MSEIEISKIVAAKIKEELVCKECLSEVEWKELTEEEIIHEDNLDDDFLLFCDRCKKQI